MATIRDMAFDFSMKRGNGKKAYENFTAGARAVLEEIAAAAKIGGIEAMVDKINFYIEELNH